MRVMQQSLTCSIMHGIVPFMAEARVVGSAGAEATIFPTL